MLGLVNRPNDISLSNANQSQAKFKSAVGGNLLQSWVNLTIVKIWMVNYSKMFFLDKFSKSLLGYICLTHLLGS